MSALAELAAELGIEPQQLRRRLAPSVSPLVPNYLTIDPKTGLIGANFTGHVHAQGLDLDVAGTAAPPDADQLRWLRPDGSVGGFLWCYDDGTVTEVRYLPGAASSKLARQVLGANAGALPLTYQNAGLIFTADPVGDLAKIEVVTNYHNQPQQTRKLIDNAGASDFAFATDPRLVFFKTVNIPTSESRSAATFDYLTTQDVIKGVPLPAGGIILIWFQALWQCAVVGQALATIAFGGTQLQVARESTVANQNASIPAAATINVDYPLFSFDGGLASRAAGLNAATESANYQAFGYSSTAQGASVSLAGTSATIVAPIGLGGPCSVFRPDGAAKTVDIGIQFRSGDASKVTVQKRHLAVAVLTPQ